MVEVQVKPKPNVSLNLNCRRLVPVSMGIVMFVLGVAIPLLIREPAKGRYTPANKVRAAPRRAPWACLAFMTLSKSYRAIPRHARQQGPLRGS